MITDLLLGAVHSDGRAPDEEKNAVRRLLADLLLTKELPPEIEARIESFDPQKFDLAATARDFASDPPMQRQRLLELVGKMCLADGVLELAEIAYVQRLAAALGMKREEYAEFVKRCEVQELRRHLRDVRLTPVGGFPRAEVNALLGTPGTPPSGVSR